MKSGVSLRTHLHEVVTFGHMMTSLVPFPSSSEGSKKSPPRLLHSARPWPSVLMLRTKRGSLGSSVTMI